jgi:hypothetical protein
VEMSSKKSKNRHLFWPQWKLYELLIILGTEVTNLIFPNDDVVRVSWKHYQDNVVWGNDFNVAVPDYVKPQAWPKV